MQGHGWASGIAHISGSGETPGEGCQVRAGALQNGVGGAGGLAEGPEREVEPRGGAGDKPAQERG